jgi:hypothetical protein
MPDWCMLLECTGRHRQSSTHHQYNHGRTTILPPGKHMAYGQPRSAHVLVFMREDIFQGVLDLYDPCNGTTLSRRPLCTKDPVENPRRLWPFARPIELDLGKTTSFEVPARPSPCVSASASWRAAMDCGMYPKKGPLQSVEASRTCCYCAGVVRCQGRSTASTEPTTTVIPTLSFVVDADVDASACAPPWS